MKNRAVKLSVVAAILAASGCSDSKSPINAASLLEERCGVCHSTDIPKNARKSRSDWEESVTRMIAKGARLSPEEKKALVNHLAKVYRR
jgi:cytochrome c5